MHTAVCTCTVLLMVTFVFGAADIGGGRSLLALGTTNSTVDIWLWRQEQLELPTKRTYTPTVVGTDTGTDTSTGTGTSTVTGTGTRRASDQGTLH